MIQELLGGAGLLGGGERKFSFHGTILEGVPSSSSSASPSLSPSPSASNTNAHTNLTTAPPPLENLRCPRCDSPNTKFCYYNNYNLTQPRHFCKTCRRYWTKGGALRNVPIGGGCRKNKSTIVSAAATGKSTTGKGKIVSSEFIKSNIGNGLDHEQSSNQVLWGSPQNSQLLSLLRGNSSNPNPNSGALPNFVHFKDEGHMIGSHVPSESAAVTGTVNARTLGLDPFGQVPPIGLYTSLFRNHQLQHQAQQHQNLSLHGDGQNNGLQELYQRLRASVNYQSDNSFATLTNVTNSMTASSSSMMESVPGTTGAEFGSWNPSFSWSDLSTTTNGAFP